MAYTFKYRLQSVPIASVDGSGCVNHDIWAIFSEDGDTWLVMPARHKTISIPFAEIDAALSQPTNPQKVTAYKDALIANLNTTPLPVVGWTADQLLTFMETNDSAAITADAANTFLTVTLGYSYPIDFSL